MFTQMVEPYLMPKTIRVNRIPAYRWTETPIKVGNTTNGQSFIGQTIWEWQHEGLLASEGHYRTPGGGWSGGGPFYVYRSKMTHGVDLRWEWWRNGSTTASISKGVGPALTLPPPRLKTGVIPSFSAATDGLSSHFATGYKRTRPGNPVASLGQFLIELRDLPKIPGYGIWNLVKTVPVRQIPRVLLNRLNVFRSLGSEYLNVQFGWAPFVSDVRKMYYLWYDIDKRMAKIIRENGRNIRRRATISDDQTTSQTSTVYPFPFANVYGGPPSYAAGSTKYTTSTTVKTRIWYSAGYRYYIPDTGSSLWNARARAALFGALPTPELLWEVLPWSWLIDWFSNVGDVVSNISPNAVDNLVMRYGFIMKHVLTKTEYQSDTSWEGANSSFGGFGSVWKGGSHAFVSTSTVETKVRMGGSNPFGLNVQLSSLSAYQLSILAALGISRGQVR